jgi:hypothetical protein
MCDNGVMKIGVKDADVQDACSEPNSQTMNECRYDFGPSQTVYTMVFKEGILTRILEDA